MSKSRRFSTRILLPVLLAALPVLARAVPSTDSSYGSAWRHIGDIWNKGGWELYVPVYTYHMPYAYTRKLLDSYNDDPWGLGVGKGRFNEAGNWEGLYVMEFADSHGKPEYEGGYAWIATWRPWKNGVRTGAGYTAFITARSDYGGYTPFPGVLPLASIGWKSADLQSTFVPGLKNNGNVLFTWLKFSF